MSVHAAIDLGASSGRVVLGDVGPGRLQLTELHRFSNRPVRLTGGLYWNVLSLYTAALDGLAKAGPELASVGVDGWAIDFGLLGSSGGLLGNPHHYRDQRTDDVQQQLSRQQLYAVNGLQHLPFTTLYQLIAARSGEQWNAARTLLLIPDLLTFWLTGHRQSELTNASTTGLLDVTTQQWSLTVSEVLGLPAGLLPPLVRPGDILGPLLPEVRQETGLSGRTVMTAVGSHDTASAVVGVPMEGDRAAYISLGTWGLVGVELEAPVLTEDSRQANFSNELGVDDRVRYLKNVMGLWLLQESLRVWELMGEPARLSALLAGAAELSRGPVFDVDHPQLLPPGDMPARIGALLEQQGLPTPKTRVHLVRCIIDSLALALGRTVHQVGRLSGRDLEVVHVVGGGARNSLLCQLIADATGLPIVAGPVEATAVGNLLVQGRALGALSGDLDALRALIRQTQHLTRYEPRP